MFQRKRRESDFHAEIEAHLQQEYEHLREEGLNERDARFAARRAFGNVMHAQENYYEAKRWLWWDRLKQDVRFALRMLAKTPGFTAVAVLTLALGIGANTVIFSAVYSVLMRAMPFKDIARLVFVLKNNPPRGWTRNNISPVEVIRWKEDSGAFEDLAAFSGASCVVAGAGEPEEDPCEVVSSNLFPVLGVAPFVGRNFSVEEDSRQAPKAVILSYGFWRRHFGSDQAVIGRAIVINGVSRVIVGVMPANFSHLYATPYGPVPEMWISGIGLSADSTDNDYWGIGRLKPGISANQAEAQLDVVSRRIETESPDLHGWRAQLLSFRENVSGDTRPALLVLMGAVFFVLLISCANMANLLLARGAGRAGEFATRTALGASRSRMIAQLLAESLVLSLAGGALGVLFAVWGCKAMAALAPKYLLNSAPGLANGVADWRVLGFAFAVVLATTLLFGLAPALQSSTPELTETLKETGRGGPQSRGSKRFRSALVASEVALAIVLLTGAGLMIRTLAMLSGLDLGFSSANVLTLRVPLSGERYKEPQAVADFWEQVVAGVKTLPGVEAASVSRGLPVDGWAGQFFTTGDQPNPPAGQIPDANYIVVGPEYFQVMRIPVKRGRRFSEQDSQTSQRIAIVNEELASRQWPGQDPLGKQVRPGGSGPWLTVVGVAGDVKSNGPDIPAGAELYVPLQQYPWILWPSELVVRTAPGVSPESLAHAVVEQVHRVDAERPAVDVKTLESIAAEPLMQQRMVMALMVSFAALALTLAMLGVYSVLSYVVARRTKEIGIRIALGALPGNVLRMVIGAGLLPVAIGILTGVGGALILTRLMKDLLFGVKPGDPATIAAVTILLLVTSLLACGIPARRVMKANPIAALRHE